MDCGCRIAGPPDIGAVLGETPVRKFPEGYYSVSLCPLHASAPDLLAALETWAETFKNHAPGMAYTRELELSRDAIRKAKGE